MTRRGMSEVFRTAAQLKLRSIIFGNIVDNSQGGEYLKIVYFNKELSDKQVFITVLFIYFFRGYLLGSNLCFIKFG